jgi:hypothetical protein
VVKRTDGSVSGRDRRNLQNMLSGLDSMKSVGQIGMDRGGNRRFGGRKNAGAKQGDFRRAIAEQFHESRMADATAGASRWRSCGDAHRGSYFGRISAHVAQQRVAVAKASQKQTVRGTALRDRKKRRR